MTQFKAGVVAVTVGEGETVGDGVTVGVPVGEGVGVALLETMVKVNCAPRCVIDSLAWMVC